MPDEILLRSPLDMHVHLRQGARLADLVRHTARDFAGALVMPNTDPPVNTTGIMSAYGHAIARAAADAGRPGFTPYLTLYFDPRYDRAFLEEARPVVTAVKFYPRGLTTNSAHGCHPNEPGVGRVLGLLEGLGIPLCVHPEAPGYHEDREALFADHVRRWARDFPALKIVLEHVSDARTLSLLLYPNVYATVTPHHLHLTGDDWVGPPLRPHRFCAPVAKRPSDRAALRLLVNGAAAPGVTHKVMLGTDSAPHPVGSKEAAACCAGVFNAPVALASLVTVFDGPPRDAPAERLQAFVSDNARAVYGIDPPGHTVRLVREPWTVPDRYRVGGEDVVPLFAGETLPWRCEPATPGRAPDRNCSAPGARAADT